MYQEYSEKEKKLLSSYSTLLENFTTIGMEVWRQKQNSQEILRHDLASLFLFRQILEMGDAISVLFKAGCINASKPLLRTLLECYLQLKYLFEINETQKGLQFMYHYETRLKEHNEKLAFPEKGGSYYEKLKKDKHLKGLDLPKWQKEIFSKNVEQINLAQNDVAYNDIKMEYERISKKRKVKYWYELFDGPTSAEEILKIVEEAALYEFIYRDCSKYAHGEDIVHTNLQGFDNDNYIIADLRDLRQLDTVAQTSIMLIERACLLFVNNKIKDSKEAVARFLPFVLEAQSNRMETIISTL
jgi:hypothetical protein